MKERAFLQNIWLETEPIVFINIEQNRHFI